MSLYRHAEDGPVLVLVDVAVAGERDLRVAHGGTRIDARNIDVARCFRPVERKPVGIDEAQAVRLVGDADVVFPMFGTWATVGVFRRHVKVDWLVQRRIADVEDAVEVRYVQYRVRIFALMRVVAFLIRLVVIWAVVVKILVVAHILVVAGIVGAVASALAVTSARAPVATPMAFLSVVAGRGVAIAGRKPRRIVRIGSVGIFILWIGWGIGIGIVRRFLLRARAEAHGLTVLRLPKEALRMRKRIRDFLDASRVEVCVDHGRTRRDVGDGHVRAARPSGSQQFRILPRRKRHEPAPQVEVVYARRSRLRIREVDVPE